MTLIGVAVAAEFATLSPAHPSYARARVALNVLAYVLAFAFFLVIYRTRARSLVTATGISGVAFLVALDLFSVAETRWVRVVLYAAVTGLLVGEATWALNYWRLDDWTASLFLLLLFYFCTGVVQQYLLERLKITVLLEFGFVMALVLILMVILRPVWGL